MLKAGFIGFGRMGITHFSILNTHPLVRTVAISEQSSTMLNILKKYLKVGLYSDYRKMIEAEDLDFVVISTPTGSHTEIIRAAIDNDLHTFVEKPFALSAAEGKETLEYLGDKTLVNQVGYVNRFNEVFTEVKRLLDNGVIGDIKHFTSEIYGATVLKDSKASWRGKRRMGGGCMYEFASHCVDLVVYLFGEPDKVSGSIMQSIYSSGVEDLVSSTFVYNRGCSGGIISNWSDEAFRKPTSIVKIFGTRGKIIADRHSYKIFLKEEDETNGFHKGWNTRHLTDFAGSVRFYVRGNEFTRQLDYFVNCIEKRLPAKITCFAEALKTDTLMDRIILDAARSVSEEEITPEMSQMPSKGLGKRKSLWKRLFS